VHGPMLEAAAARRDGRTAPLWRLAAHTGWARRTVAQRSPSARTGWAPRTAPQRTPRACRTRIGYD